MRFLKTFWALGALFVGAVLIAGCGGSGLSGTDVASVAGNPISLQAFNHWMYVAEKGNSANSGGGTVIVPNDPPKFANCIKLARSEVAELSKASDTLIRSDCQALFTSLSSQVMNYLIEAYWYQAQAAKEGITLTPAQLSKAFAQAKKSQFTTTAQYTAFLTETGQTQADIEFRVRVNKIYSLLIAKLTPKITDKAISAYYAAHQSEFGTPATRNIRFVRTNSQAQAQAAYSALKSGKSWAVVAKQYSVDQATKNSGGLLTGITSGEEDAALNKLAFNSPIGVVEGPVHGTFGWYVAEVEKITPGTASSLTKETPLIKQLLTSQYQTAATTKLNKLAKSNWGSQTTCAKYYEMADCHGYKAPSTTTSTTPAGTATQTVQTQSATTGAGTATTHATSGTATTSSKSSGTSSTLDTQ